METILDADTLLAIDIGTVNTRASLFDVVDGRYRLITTGRAPSCGLVHLAAAGMISKTPFSVQE